MNLLTIKHLEEENVGTIYIANRSIEKFKEIQNLYDNIEYVEYKDRYNILKEDKIDIVISATSSPHLVIKKEDLIFMPIMNKLDLGKCKEFAEKLNNL